MGKEKAHERKLESLKSAYVIKGARADECLIPFDHMRGTFSNGLVYGHSAGWHGIKSI